jgi:hypothetical protein
MPRKKRNGLFDFLKPRTTVYHVKRRKSKPSHLSSKIRSLGSHRIVRVGDHYEVPSLDRGSWFDTRDEAQRFIREMRKYNPKRRRSASALALALPKNKWFSGKFRVTSGGVVQAQASESIVGHVGASGSAGLSGVSVKGGAKVNRRRRRKK